MKDFANNKKLSSNTVKILVKNKPKRRNIQGDFKLFFNE